MHDPLREPGNKIGLEKRPILEHSGLIICVLGIAFCIFAVFYMILPTSQTGASFGEEVRFLPLVFVALFFLLAFLLYRDLVGLFTKLTTEGVKQPGLFGAVFTKWGEVTHFKLEERTETNQHPYTHMIIKLTTPSRTVSIDGSFAKDQNAFVTEILSRLPASASGVFKTSKMLWGEEEPLMRASSDPTGWRPTHSTTPQNSPETGTNAWWIGS